MLAETGNFIKRFVGSGLAELGDKLGPLLWQFAPFKRFDKEDFGTFLDHLPRELDGHKLNHVVEVRHASFGAPGLRSSCCATPASASSSPTPRAGPTSPISPATSSMPGCSEATTHSTPPIRPRELDAWAKRAQASGPKAERLTIFRVVDAAHQARDAKPRDVFIYFIHEGKLRAPAAAMALIERLD